MTVQTTLQSMIQSGQNLTDDQKDSLFQLVAKGCHPNTKERLYRKIYIVPLSCWASYGIFGRVHLESNGKFSYCAGQSYPDEIRTVRQCLL